MTNTGNIKISIDGLKNNHGGLCPIVLTAIVEAEASIIGENINPSDAYAKLCHATGLEYDDRLRTELKSVLSESVLSSESSADLARGVNMRLGYKTQPYHHSRFSGSC